jgi:UDP:flavonoid glycosyltransferase YjiC (YdhE family)
MEIGKVEIAEGETYLIKTSDNRKSEITSFFNNLGERYNAKFIVYSDEDLQFIDSNQAMDMKKDIDEYLKRQHGLDIPIKERLKLIDKYLADGYFVEIVNDINMIGYSLIFYNMINPEKYHYISIGWNEIIKKPISKVLKKMFLKHQAISRSIVKRLKYQLIDKNYWKNKEKCRGEINRLTVPEPAYKGKKQNRFKGFSKPVYKGLKKNKGLRISMESSK